MDPIFDMINIMSRTRRKEYTYNSGALGFAVPVALTVRFDYFPVIMLITSRLTPNSNVSFFLPADTRSSLRFPFFSWASLWQSHKNLHSSASCYATLETSS